MEKAGIYIHVPFCVRKCPYCDFYSVPYDPALAARYTEAVCAQMQLAPRVQADTVYFGGGTPSLLDPALIDRMLEAAAQRFALSEGCEVTLEMNPATCTAEKLRALRAAGINRLSIGVQSTDDAVLRQIGRLHDRQGALDTIALAAACGFENISADVMLALPQESEAALMKTIRELCALPVTHLSAYLLKIMPGTPFAAHRPDGIPDDDDQAVLYEKSCALLDRCGFVQYEISNFSRGGRYPSRHNLKYWHCAPYYGFGAAAHSSVGGKLYSFPRSIDCYLEAFGGSGCPAGSDAAFCAPLNLETELSAQDFIMLSLRLTAGLDLDELERRFDYCFPPETLRRLDGYARAGLCESQGRRLWLTRRGMLVSNALLAEIL